MKKAISTLVFICLLVSTMAIFSSCGTQSRVGYWGKACSLYIEIIRLDEDGTYTMFTKLGGRDPADFLNVPDSLTVSYAQAFFAEMGSQPYSHSKETGTWKEEDHKIKCTSSENKYTEYEIHGNKSIGSFQKIG